MVTGMQSFFDAIESNPKSKNTSIHAGCYLCCYTILNFATTHGDWRLKTKFNPIRPKMVLIFSVLVHTTTPDLFVHEYTMKPLPTDGRIFPELRPFE